MNPAEVVAIQLAVETYRRDGLQVSFFAGYTDGELLLDDGNGRYMNAATITTAQEAEDTMQRWLEQQRNEKRYGMHRE